MRVNRQRPLQDELISLFNHNISDKVRHVEDFIFNNDISVIDCVDSMKLTASERIGKMPSYLG